MQKRVEKNKDCYWCAGSGTVLPEQGVTFGGQECTACDSAALLREQDPKPYAYAVGNQLFWDRQEAIAAAEKTPVYDLYLRSAFKQN